MALKSVENLREDVQRVLTGIDLDDTPDFNGAAQQAVATFIQKADVPEASANVPVFLYDRVTDYKLDTDLFNASIIDLCQQGVERQAWDEVVKEPQERWDQQKGWTPSGYNVTFRYDNGQQIMRVAQNKTVQAVTLDGMSQTTDWVASGGASGLAQDNTVYWHQPAALRFNLAAAGSPGVLTKTLTNALDLSDYAGVGVIFLANMFPAGSEVTGITLRIGSSPTDYYEIAVTRGFLGAFPTNQFALTAFNLAGVAPTGSPDMSAVNYVQLSVAYGAAAQANVRFGDLWIALPSANQLLFYTPAVFLAEGSTTPTAGISDDTDTIIFRDGSYNIYMLEVARQVAQDQGGDIASGLIAGLDLVLEGNGEKKIGLYQAYRGDNPSEELRQIGSYYEGGWGGANFTGGND